MAFLAILNKADPAISERHDGSGKEQQTTFHWNKAHKTWKTTENKISPKN